MQEKPSNLTDEQILARQRLAAMRRIEPYLDAIVCYASTCGEHEPNAIVREFRDAIAGDWVLEKRLADRLAERAARQSRGLGYGESVSDKYLEAEIYELQAAISKEQP